MFAGLEMWFAAPQFVCFDGDGDGGDGGDGEGGDGGGSGGEGTDSGLKLFTQEEVNNILANDKRSLRQNYEKIEKQYKELLQKSTLTVEERDKLSENLKNVQSQLRSKEEIAKHEKEQLKAQLEERIKALEAQNTQSDSRYKNLLVTRALQDAAIEGDAFRPEQIVTILKPMVSVGDDDQVMIDFPDISSDTGEQVISKMSPHDVVKRMKQLDETYGNLFKSNVVSGVGGSSATGGMKPGSDGRVDVRKLTMEQYVKLRKENPQALGFRS